MTAMSGRAFLLKIGDGGSPETFTTIAGARSNGMSLSNAPVDVTTKESNGVQELLAGAGAQAMTLSISGRFTDAASEETFRLAAFDRTKDNYQIAFPNGDTYVAAFLIGQYDRTGEDGDAETFSATLRRSGPGVYSFGV